MDDPHRSYRTSNNANRQGQSAQARLPRDTLAPKPFKLMLNMETYFQDCGLEPNRERERKQRMDDEP